MCEQFKPMNRKGHFVEGGRRANLCNACGLHYRKGHFCKFCNEIYRDVNELVSTEPWILCCACERYMHRKCVQQAGMTLPKSNSHQHISQSHHDQFYCDECGGGANKMASNESNVTITVTPTISLDQYNTQQEKKEDSLNASMKSSPVVQQVESTILSQGTISTSPPKSNNGSGCGSSRPLSFQAPPSMAQVKVATRPFTVSADRENVVSLLMRHNESAIGMMNGTNPFVNINNIEEFEQQENHSLTNYYNLKNRPLPPIPSCNSSSNEPSTPPTSVNSSGNALPSINFLLTRPNN